MKQGLHLIIIFCFFSVVYADNKTTTKTETHIYQLNHFKASQVIPVIQPHLSPSSQLTAHKFQLIVTAITSEHEKVKSLIKQLDKKVHSYIVEVKILARPLAKWQLKSSKIILQGSSKQVSSKHFSTQSINNANKYFKLNLIEGYQGFIKTGETFPSQKMLSQYQEFLPKDDNSETLSGFYLTVTEKANQRVELLIATQAEQVSKNSTSIKHTSAASTKLITNKNEWILFAATGDDKTTQEKSISQHFTTHPNKQAERWYYLKIK